MDVDQYLRDPVSRRRFFALSGVSVAGGSAVFLGACGEGDNSAGGPGQSEVTKARSPRDTDVQILNTALDLEHMAVAAYTAGAKLLKGATLAAGKTFRQHEQEHADGLTRAIKDLGGKPNKARASYDFPSLRSEQNVLNFAVDIESTAVAAYIDALPKLATPDLRATASAIVTNEAEHIAVLLGALGKEQAPDAFVTGKG
jgi:rubrerythrin